MQIDVPSVLAVLVTRNGAAWLPRALRSLARQTHPRLGILAVDNASTDGSAEILERSLGAKRVVRTERNLGYAGAIQRVLDIPAVRRVDFLLLLHDDVALAPSAVARLVEEAERVSGAGVVGPKVLDWDGRVLLEVGFSADRFGAPHSPVEEGELDQGQYDAPREVLFVSSAVMLVSREVLERVGPPDVRLASPDLDLCWRIRLAGYRILVTPRAVAVHRMARARGERPGGVVRPRYEAERAALAAMLVNYRPWTLAWSEPAGPWRRGDGPWATSPARSPAAPGPSGSDGCRNGRSRGSCPRQDGECSGGPPKRRACWSAGARPRWRRERSSRHRRWVNAWLPWWPTIPWPWHGSGRPSSRLSLSARCCSRRRSRAGRCPCSPRMPHPSSGRSRRPGGRPRSVGPSWPAPRWSRSAWEASWRSAPPISWADSW